jgi:hypothetical protein
VTALLIAHAVATLGMTGLVWFVQLVHYPMFAAAGPAAFPAYEEEHTRRTNWIVAPLWGTETVTALALLVLDPGPLTWIGAALIGALWVSTVFVQVPCHRLLSVGWDADTHRRLVRTNWARTVMWSARAAIALALLAA